MPLLYQSGSQWNYPYATGVCARLIEVLGGVGVDEFLRSGLFEPLGMTDTAFDIKPADAQRLVTSYRYVPPDVPLAGSTVSGDETLLFPHIGSFEAFEDPSRAFLLSDHRPKYLSG